MYSHGTTGEAPEESSEGNMIARDQREVLGPEKKKKRQRGNPGGFPILPGLTRSENMEEKWMVGR